MDKPYAGDRDRVVVAFTLEDGTQAYVEARADGPDDHGRTMVAGGTAAKGFANVAATIKSLTTDLKSAILAAAPQEAELEFGIDLKIETGGLAASRCA